MNESSIKQAYLRLMALKANLPERPRVDQTYVEEFHTILDILQEDSEQDLNAFRVPAGEIEKESSGSNYLNGEVFYTGRMVCHRTYLMMRIDGLLGFFTLSSPKTTVGFKPS